MAARYALHRIGADLGDQIEVQADTSPSANNNSSSARVARIIVHGVVDSPERKEELLLAVSEIPHLETNIHTPEEIALLHPPDAPSGESTVTSTEIVSSHSPIEKRLLEYCGGQISAESFSKQAFAIAQDLMAEAWALKHLEERYPNTERVRLSASSRQLLDLMLRDHREALFQHTAELSALLEPLLRPIASPAIVGLGLARAQTSDIAASLSVLASAQQIESLTIELLSGSESTSRSQAEDIPVVAQDLLASLEDLKVLGRELK
jgi:hypothetical protein